LAAGGATGAGAAGAGAFGAGAAAFGAGAAAFGAGAAAFGGLAFGGVALFSTGGAGASVEDFIVEVPDLFVVLFTGQLPVAHALGALQLGAQALQALGAVQLGAQAGAAQAGAQEVWQLL